MPGIEKKNNPLLEADKQVAHFKQLCQESGLRVTHQRLIIFNEIVSTSEHPDVETIFKRVRKKLPTISLDTIYRTLTTMESYKIISRVDPTGGRIRYDANRDEHHHFVCTVCGKIQDFYLNPDECLAPPIEAKKAGQIKSLHMQVRGICKTCTG